MKARHLLSIAEIGATNLRCLLHLAFGLAAGENGGIRPLHGKMVGTYFRRSSTRTRTSFTVAAMKLGAGTIHYGPKDLQICTGESVRDTARVLSGFLDVLIIRTNETVAEMELFAEQDTMSVINAMSESEHPTQAIADLVTIRETLGRLEGVHILYVGEGNNTAASLALATAQLPKMRMTLVTPEGYGLNANILGAARDFGERHGSLVEQHHRLDNLPKNVDVVYTTRWETAGELKAENGWRKKFEPYCVTPKLMAQVSKGEETIFLHDLPAIRGSEVVNEVLDGPQSRAFELARHKLTSALAVLTWCAAAD
ncbi:MAG: ornithine carbamoyltransferase [Acidobacteriota bacterium]